MTEENRRVFEKIRLFSERSEKPIFPKKIYPQSQGMFFNEEKEDIKNQRNKNFVQSEDENSEYLKENISREKVVHQDDIINNDYQDSLSEELLGENNLPKGTEYGTAQKISDELERLSQRYAREMEEWLYD